LAPFSARRLLVRANDGAVDHQILVVAIGQSSEQALPDASMAPVAEAPMHRFPLAVPLRQVAPACVRPQNPQTSVDEQTIIRSRTSRVASLPRQQWRYLRPLRLSKLISLRRHLCSVSKLRNSMNQRSNHLGILIVEVLDFCIAITSRNNVKMVTPFGNTSDENSLQVHF
jgi:hypothetical protein